MTVKRSRGILGLVILAIVAALAVYLYAGHTPPAGQPPLTRLTAANFDQFRDAFNASKDSVRIVALLSPT